MSGNTIGGIAGGIIGFAITGTPMGAQWGWMIGSVVGGIVDPQTIQGAQWQNQQLQGSADGLGRAVIFGTATVTGNLLDAEPNGPRIGKKTEGGKGGPEVERDTAILTYAIEICDSSELRGTKVNGVIAVWEDEKLVYDVRPDVETDDEGNDNIFIKAWKIAHSKKWDRNKKFYFGGENQTPPPELEAIHGSGNIPAYRGSCIMVVHDEDLMVDIDDKPRGRIPTYRFLVSACAPVLPDTPAFLPNGIYPAGSRARVHPMTSGMNFIGDSSTDIGAGQSSNVGTIVRFDGRMFAFTSNEIGEDKVLVADVDNLAEWGAGPDLDYPNPFFGIVGAWATKSDLWIAAKTSGIYRLRSGATEFENISGFNFPNESPRTIVGICAGVDAVLCCDYLGFIYARYGSYGDFQPIGYVRPLGVHLNAEQGLASNGETYVITGMSPYGKFQTYYSEDNGNSWIESSVPDAVTKGMNAMWVGGDNWIIAASGPDANGFFISHDNARSFNWIALPVAVQAGGPSPIAVDSKTLRVVLTGRRVSDEKIFMFWSSEEAEWAWSEVSQSGADMEVGATFTLNPLYGDSTPIPDSPGYYVDGDGNVVGPDMPIASLCGAPLDQVVRKLHKLGAPQLSDDEFDLEPLEGDIVRGYAIQDAAVTVAEACDPLRRVWTFDLPSYDGQIHAIKRGRDVDWTLPEDDLIAMDSDYEQSMQDDTVSLPRKLHLAYSDLNIDYKETTQISERYSTDVRVVGEEKISMGQLVLSATEAKQAVVKQHKLAWLNAEDTRTLSAPLEYIGAVNSDIVQFRGRRYRVDQMRVEGLQVTFESAAYDRASSYQSTAVGTEGVPPPPMGSSLRGPTVSVFMNLPVLRDADDKAGIYWAASGLLEGWRGALLQMSRDGTTFENMNIAVPTPCTIGTLQAGILSASRYGLDEVNQIMVKLNPLSPGLDSTDMDGLLREANSAAILYADGTAEIVQFLTATETAPREYTLSGLLRGRLDTTPGAHNAGAKFVLLNDAIRFVPLRNDDVGATITFRAMSAGTVAENNESVALTLGSFKSLAEWEPAMVRATTGTNEVSVTWVGRGRLGSSRMPVHSLNFDKYRVRVTKSGTTATVETGNQYATVTYTGISEPYTTGVTALSRIDAQFNSPEGTA